MNRNHELRESRAWILHGFLLLSLLSLACAGSKAPETSPFEQLRSAIEENVGNELRADAMKSTTGQMESAMDELLRLAASTNRDLARLVADHGTTRAQFDELHETYLERRRPIAERILELHLQLRSRASAEERKALSKKEHEVFERFLNVKITPPDEGGT